VKLSQVEQISNEERERNESSKLDMAREEALERAHTVLERVLKDKLKVEDGQRLGSIESLKASGGNLEIVLDEFESCVEQLDLAAKDEQVYQAIDQIWTEATERLNTQSETMKGFFKKSK
jgi:uncharacterized protein (UPF0147 family)